MNEYCVPCLQDETKVIAAKVLGGVPLCSGCADVFSDDPVALADMRKSMRVVPPPTPRFEETGIEPAPYPAPVKHVPIHETPKVVEVVPVSQELCDCGKVARHKGRCIGTKNEPRLEQIVRRESEEIVVPEKQIVRQTKRERVTSQVEHTQEVETWTAGQERTSKINVELPSGGKLSLEWSGHLFAASPEDRNFIFAISDRMKSYANQKAVPLPYKNFAIVAPMEENFIIDMLDMMDQEQQNIVIDWVQEAAKVVKERRNEK